MLSNGISVTSGLQGSHDSINFSTLRNAAAFTRTTLGGRRDKKADGESQKGPSLLLRPFDFSLPQLGERVLLCGLDIFSTLALIPKIIFVTRFLALFFLDSTTRFKDLRRTPAGG